MPSKKPTDWKQAKREELRRIAAEEGPLPISMMAVADWPAVSHEARRLAELMIGPLRTKDPGRLDRLAGRLAALESLAASTDMGDEAEDVKAAADC